MSWCKNERNEHYIKNEFSADLVTFTDEILHGKLHFLCNGSNKENKWANGKN